MKKNAVYILSTVLVVVGVCYYLCDANANYDGGLIDSLLPFIFTMPLIMGISLWCIITGENEVPPKKKLWKKTVSVIAYVMVVAAIGCFLIDSKFYDLSSIIFAVLLVTLIPCSYIDYKKGGRIFDNPVLNWAVVMSGIYSLIFVVVFTYIQVVSPITVTQATSLVAERYGEYAYEFAGHLDFHEEYNPLGVYWFEQRDDDSKGWVQVDLLTGDLSDVEPINLSQLK